MIKVIPKIKTAHQLGNIHIIKFKLKMLMITYQLLKSSLLIQKVLFFID